MVDINFIKKSLTKYQMFNLLNYVESIYNCEQINHYNFISDLQLFFQDQQFIQQYEKLIEQIKQKNLNSIVENNNQFIYKLPKTIDWSNYLSSQYNIDEIIQLIKNNQISNLKSIITNYESIPKKISLYMYEHGINLLKKGQVAIITMSGGDGSRLGYNGPKGMYPIGMISKDTFFKIFSQKLKSLSKICGYENECKIPFYIMTSSTNHDIIQNYFQNNNYFGLNKNNITFFQQESVPVIDLQTGSFLLKDEFNLLKSPNGNGSIFISIHNNQIIQDMKKKGIKYVFIHCIDNPLCKICDPFFIGYSDLFQLQIATKTVQKKHMDEKIGSIAEKYDKYAQKSYPHIVEYTEINQLSNYYQFELGSIGIHLFHIDFLQQISENCELQYHIAIKKASYMDYNQGIFSTINPLNNNVIKLEMFIFDCFQFTSIPIHFINVSRDEFSPVKSKEGDDCPSKCQHLVSNINKKWLNNFLTNKLSQSQFLEISPLVSYNGENLEKFSNIQHYNKKFVYINDNYEVILLEEI